MLGLLVALQVGLATPVGSAAFKGATFDPLVTAGIAEGVFPGAVLVIGRRDSLLFERGYGHLTWAKTSPVPDPDSTLWDLASLTKVLATTTAVMLLVDRGLVRLDAPVVTYVPAFGAPGTAAITVRELLTHTSGLKPTLPLFREPDSAAALRRVHEATPVVPPGSRVVYSDLNGILLGEIVQHVSGEPLDRFVAREVCGPLALDHTLFRPPAALRREIAPTGEWHGHPVAGVVNDQNAVRLGGVAGHAGLFSTGADVARFAQFILRGGTTADGHPLVRRATLEEFTTAATPVAGTKTERRALGWQAVPTGETVSSAGTRFGPRSIGHTGWTGTSLWIDPDRDLFVVLLTNRAFAPRTRRPFTRLKEVRGKVADAAAQASDGS
ncbi:MAG TPA: serine hydrolase domain-containing protein [Gemmatimonadales bacterium]|nr:serine hydrolase domain-containing protein [Gemmatimonadales bacterium]